jgi:hypothetical protein
MKNLKLYETIATTIPTFEYINGIAYEITIDVDNVQLSLNRNGTLGLQCKKKMQLSTEIISSIMNILEQRLNKEVDKNKLNWYYEAN